MAVEVAQSVDKLMTGMTIPLKPTSPKESQTMVEVVLIDCPAMKS